MFAWEPALRSNKIRRIRFSIKKNFGTNGLFMDGEGGAAGALHEFFI